MKDKELFLHLLDKGCKTVEFWRNPTPFEIKKGYGAIHRLDVPVDFVKKPDGNIKKWFISPFDGLRYYHV